VKIMKTPKLSKKKTNQPKKKKKNLNQLLKHSKSSTPSRSNSIA
jgi:hypothetical protein